MQRKGLSAEVFEEKIGSFEIRRGRSSALINSLSNSETFQADQSIRAGRI